MNNSSFIELNPTKVNEKTTLIEENQEALLTSLDEKDKELTRLLAEKEILLSRFVNVPQNQTKLIPGHVSELVLSRLNECH